MASLDIETIRQQAGQFFNAIEGLLAAKDVQIADLTALLEKTQSALTGLATVKSDFMLLKEKAISDAKRVSDEIAVKLAASKS